MSCLQAHNHEVMERYLQDQMSGSEAESFEDHILECEECAAELERLATVGAELARRRNEIEEEPVSTNSPHYVLLAMAAMLALAIGLLVLFQPWQKDGFEFLASIEPPEYRESQLRGAADKADDWFKAGMDWYLEANYEEAITDLGAALEQDPDRVEVAFFLGASQLLSGAPETGIQSLEKVIALGDTPFLEEALYLRAQAYLLLGEAGEAAQDLRSIVELDGDWESRASIQLEQLEALSKADS